MKNLGDKISIILPDDLKEEIDKLRALYKEDQSSYIRKLLWKSIAQEKLNFAIKEYLNDKISIGKATEIAGISIWEMLDELKNRNITLNYKISEAELEKLSKLRTGAPYIREDFYEDLKADLIKTIPKFLKSDALFRVALTDICKKYNILNKYTEIYDKVNENV